LAGTEHEVGGASNDWCGNANNVIGIEGAVAVHEADDLVVGTRGK
jgi:hypothetical protein